MFFDHHIEVPQWATCRSWIAKRAPPHGAILHIAAWPVNHKALRNLQFFSTTTLNVPQDGEIPLRPLPLASSLSSTTASRGPVASQ